MDDSFRVRVDKVFGSLGSGGTMPSSMSVSITSPTATPSASLWCLTDQEIERRQWNLHHDNDEASEDEEEGGEMTDKSGPPPPPFGLSTSTNQMMRDSDEEEEEEEEAEAEAEEEIEIQHDKKKKQKQLLRSTTKRGIADEEDWDIESNIGRDCTLDFEEEEDKYDKVAAGAEEKSGDRIYMKDCVKFSAEYDTIHHELNTYGELPDSCQAVVRDPRANHTAARIRLKEDAEAAGNFNALLQLSDNVSVPKNNNNNSFDDSDHHHPPKKGDEDVADVEDNPKPILKKRGEIQMESSSGSQNKKKRVRFVMSDSNNHEEEQNQQLQPHPPSSSNNQLSSYGVPDYVKNPSKYTRYTLDDSDMDDQSNQKAYMDFLTRRRESSSDDKAALDDLSSSASVDDTSTPISRVVFTPKRKPGSTMVERSQCEEEKSGGGGENRKGGSGSSSIGCVTMDTQEEETDEICAMEEDTPASCVPAAVDKDRLPQKPRHRHYRTRTSVDTEDNNVA